MQTAVPEHPLLGAPRPAEALLRTLEQGQSIHPYEPRPRKAPAPAGAVRAFTPDMSAWPLAVEASANVCLGESSAACHRVQAVQAKLDWLAGLTSASCEGPVLFLSGVADNSVEANAFMELIPARSSHVPLPDVRPGDLYLTCIHGYEEAQSDVRPDLLRKALAQLPEVVGRGVSVWAAAGRCSAYPNGPAWLFLEAGFEIVAPLGTCALPGRGYDETLLLRWQPPGTEQLPVALHLDPRDNVATVPHGCEAGEPLAVHASASAPRTIVPLSTIPPGHKLAIVDIPAGEAVVKYGQPIGLASSPIASGDHVHTHNLVSDRAGGGSR